jgi:hypothetical protein
MHHIVVSLLFAGLFPEPLDGFHVGSTAGCTHQSIQDAVDAAKNKPGPDTIRLTRSIVYASQSIVIDTDEDLTIAGGLAGCGTAFTEDDLVEIDGAGGSDASVFRISAGAGTRVRLIQLRIRNGDPSLFNGDGGGIRYEGGGVLELQNVAVANNRAVRGGGIFASGDVETATLVIGSNVTISGNVATADGGGVFVDGMSMEMLAPNSIIAFNEALGAGRKGYGGGLAIRSVGDRRGIAYVAGTGVGGLGAIYGNTAKWGGGVAASAASGATADAVLKLYSVDAASPGAIRGNFASEGGGAIYLWPDKSATSEASAVADIDVAVLEGNAAPEGAAIYADYSDVSGDSLPPQGSRVRLLPSVPPPPGGIACPEGRPCVAVLDHVAEDANGTDTDGALFFVERRSDLDAERVELRANRVGRLLDLRDDGGDLTGASARLGNSLVVDNATRQELFRGTAGADLRLRDATVARNAIGAPDLIALSRSRVALERTILWQPGVPSTLKSGSGTPSIDDVIASEVASLAAGPEAIVASPRFIDPERGDFRLRAASPAIDFAPAVAGDDRDAAALPRDQRIDLVPRPFGRVRDIGAFERQQLLPIVLNGDFAGDANLWFIPAGHTGNYQVDNAPGSAAGTGSAQVVYPNEPWAHVYGYAQCIQIPGPGSYLLNGSARSVGDPALANDTALLWELRADGGPGCIDGPVTVNGIHYLSTRSTTDQWTRPPQPAQIDVPAATWNANTSLTLILAVYPNASNAGFNAQFDRITLEAGTLAPPPPPDALFSNGFENP